MYLFFFLAHEFILFHRLIVIFALHVDTLTGLDKSIECITLTQKQLQLYLTRHDVAWHNITQDILIH
jgi:hypothetical protein